MADDIDAKYLAWQSTTQRSDWSYDEFCEITKDWNVFPVKGGAVLTNGPQIHACIFPNSLSKKALKVLYTVLQEYGEAITSTKIGNKTGETFVSKLGFKKIHTDRKSTRLNSSHT